MNDKSLATSLVKRGKRLEQAIHKFTGKKLSRNSHFRMQRILEGPYASQSLAYLERMANQHVLRIVKQGLFDQIESVVKIFSNNTDKNYARVYEYIINGTKECCSVDVAIAFKKYGYN